MSIDELRQLPIAELERMRVFLVSPHRAFESDPAARGAYLEDVDQVLLERRASA
jgi:hypothetical protein